MKNLMPKSKVQPYLTNIINKILARDYKPYLPESGAIQQLVEFQYQLGQDDLRREIRGWVEKHQHDIAESVVPVMGVKSIDLIAFLGKEGA